MKNILIIDDDSTISDILYTLFSEEGYRVKSLKNGKNLTDELKKFSPDLFIVDYLMPGMTGAEITSLLRARKDTTRKPIIMVAANPLYKKEAIQAGVSLFLNKPFDIYELLASAKNLINSSAQKAKS